MTQRSANHAIKGYLYQFYKTIEEILLSDDNTEITVEGIEDIDLHCEDKTNYIQCKYHEATRFAPSVIYKPIGLMLKHSIENTSTASCYNLYAYFGENSPENSSWITDDFLRKSLENVANNITASDSQLTIFRGKFRFNIGVSFDDMYDVIQNLLQLAFNCGSTDVEHYYYNNAVTHVAELSAQTDINKRRIKKNAFKEHINNKFLLFDMWQQELKGKRTYIKTIRERLKNDKALANNKRRFLYISHELVDNLLTELSVNTLLQNLVHQYTIIGKLYNSELWTIIIDAEPMKIREIKANLLKHDIYYNDGYEEIMFCAEYFNNMPIKQKKQKGDNVLKSSHDLRLLSAVTFREKIDEIVNKNQFPHIFINTTRNFESNQFFLDRTNVGVYHLAALENLSDLNEILKQGT